MSDDKVVPFPDPNGPDSEFVRIDEKGQKMFFFVAEYAFDDAKWSVEFWAYSMDEALQRVAAMRESVGASGVAQILQRIDG